MNEYRKEQRKEGIQISRDVYPVSLKKVRGFEERKVRKLIIRIKNVRKEGRKNKTGQQRSKEVD